MTKLFMIIEVDYDGRAMVRQSLGTSVGINKNRILKVESEFELWDYFKMSHEILPSVAVIMTRYKDKVEYSHETNKLYSSTNTYEYYVLDMKDEMDIINADCTAHLNNYRVSEQEFLTALYADPMIKVIQEALRLTGRKRREEVEMSIYVKDNYWCYTTDIPFNKPEGLRVVFLKIPLYIMPNDLDLFISNKLNKQLSVAEVKED